jgi:3-hydroxybutyryl-CoA dehydratase
MKKGDAFTQSFIASEEIHDKFIELFRDRNRFHTDTMFAISKGFRDKLMHGNVLNGFLSYFIGECLPYKNAVIHSQIIEYSKPVYINDRLNLFANIEEIHESINVIEFKYYFKNQDNVKVAKGKFQLALLT